MQALDSSSLVKKNGLGMSGCCLLCMFPTFPYLLAGPFRWKSVCLFDSEELSSALIQRLDHVSQGAST